MAFLQLKEKLENEGLFDQSHKKPLPLYPKTIGIATSPTGAAIRDVVSVLKRRYPYARVQIFPCMVQGSEAAGSVKKAVDYFNKKNKADVILITRGGGSFEDLSAFNDEGLARAVFNSKIPVVSAVGHEIDYTILDFVADARAATPSVAAEIIAPDREFLINDVIYYKNIISKNFYKRLNDNIQKLNYLKKKTDMQQSFSKQSIYLDKLYDKINSSMKNNLGKQYYRLHGNIEKLKALSPLNVLSRGYALAYNEEKIIKSVDDINSGDNITLKVKDGEIYCVTKDSRKFDRQLGNDL
jgi:exodeoxyribonuclease VII large subunit